MKKAICLILAIVVAVTSINVFPSYAVDLYDDIPGVDYSRLSWDGQLGGYVALATVGDMTFEGDLTRAGKLTREELNGIIYEIFDMNGIDSSYLVLANDRIKAAQQDGIITGEDYYHMVDNFATILGFDMQLHMGRDIFEAISGRTGQRQQNVMQTFLETGVFNYNEFNALKYSMQNLGSVQGFMEFAASMSINVFEKLQKYNALRFAANIGADANPVLKAIEFTYNLLKVCYQEHKRDVARWNRRVKALEACYFVRSFYSAVEELCQHRYAEHAQWRLQINGKGIRFFDFMNSSMNVQYVDFSCNMSKDNTGSKFDDSRPTGKYYGRATITLTHDMSPFDASFWDNPCGGLYKGWFSKCKAMPFYETTKSGKTTIKRTMKTYPMFFSIYSSDYNRSLTTRDNIEITKKIKYTDFLVDDIEIECDQKASVTGGANFIQDGVGSVGFVAANLKAHAEKGPGYIKIFLDSADGLADLLGVKLMDEKFSARQLGTFWDDNIWESVRYGVTISVYL